MRNVYTEETLILWYGMVNMYKNIFQVFNILHIYDTKHSYNLKNIEIFKYGKQKLNSQLSLFHKGCVDHRIYCKL